MGQPLLAKTCLFAVGCLFVINGKAVSSSTPPSCFVFDVWKWFHHCQKLHLSSLSPLPPQDWCLDQDKYSKHQRQSSWWIFHRILSSMAAVWSTLFVVPICQGILNVHDNAYTGVLSSHLETRGIYLLENSWGEWRDTSHFWSDSNPRPPNTRSER